MSESTAQTTPGLYEHYPNKDWLVAELRSDHAGETGAVWIYRGILALSRHPEVRRFAQRHLATEREHLDVMNQLLLRQDRSWFLPLWRVSGFVLGALPALISQRQVFLTINAVETFVETHYQQQIARLQKEGQQDLAMLLTRCMEDEVEHQQEAKTLMGEQKGRLDDLIRWCVGAGSQAAVALARLR